jgi:hypothetical protein
MDRSAITVANIAAVIAHTDLDMSAWPPMVWS